MARGVSCHFPLLLCKSLCLKLLAFCLQYHFFFLVFTSTLFWSNVVCVVRASAAVQRVEYFHAICGGPDTVTSRRQPTGAFNYLHNPQCNRHSLSSMATSTTITEPRKFTPHCFWWQFFDEVGPRTSHDSVFGEVIYNLQYMLQCLGGMRAYVYDNALPNATDTCSVCESVPVFGMTCISLLYSKLRLSESGNIVGVELFI